MRSQPRTRYPFTASFPRKRESPLDRNRDPRFRGDDTVMVDDAVMEEAVMPLIPGPKNVSYVWPIHPRTGGLQATVAGWASHGIASHVRSATGRPCDERSMGAIPDVSEKKALRSGVRFIY